MLLIIVLVLIAKLASVCDGCDVGTSEVDNFDWKQVDISVNTRFLNHQLSILVIGLIFHLWLQKRTLKTTYQNQYIRANE
jgi:hypothetical protein